MGRILTEELAKEAIRQLQPSIEAMLAVKEAAWGPRHIAFVVGGPGFNRRLCGYIGEPVSKEDWDSEWGEYKHESSFLALAHRKYEAARRNGEPTSVTIALHPEKFEEQEYLYPGGVAEEKDGIAVGVSGLYGHVDEWIAWWIYHAVVTLCQQDAVDRIARKEKQI